MELAEKGSLQELLDNIRRSLTPAGFNDTHKQIIITGIAYGLKYLHSLEILHRDIKPGNILLDKNYYPKITDFNLSKKMNPEDRTNQSRTGVGTPNYMAPEIITEVGYEKPVDVYAYGILLYEVITNKVPYQELRDEKMSDFDIKKKIVGGYRPILDGFINDPLKNLITSCW